MLQVLCGRGWLLLLLLAGSLEAARGAASHTEMRSCPYSRRGGLLHEDFVVLQNVSECRSPVVDRTADSLDCDAGRFTPGDETENRGVS